MKKYFLITAIIFPLLLTGNISQAQDRQTPGRTTYGKHIFLENLSADIRYIGEEYADYLKTQNSYSVKGWNAYDKGLWFSKSGNLYGSKKQGKNFTKLLDFKKHSIKNAKQVDVCGERGYLFTDDEDGDEYSAVFLAVNSNTPPQKISTGRANNRSLTMSNGNNHVAYASAKARSGVWKLFHQETCAGKKTTKLYEGRAPVYPKDFHPDDTHLLADTPFRNGDKLSEYDLSTGTEKVLLTLGASINDASYSADGRYVFYTTSADQNYIGLFRYDRQSGKTLNVVGDLGADIEKLIVSKDRTRIAVLLNKSGLDHIIVLDAVAMKLISGPSKISPGVISSAYFSPNGKKMALKLSQPNVPARSGMYDNRREKFMPWTGGFKSGQNITNLPLKITTYPSFDMVDGKLRRIPLLSYKPKTASATNPAPVVILAHGGPASQARPSYNKFYHYVVTQMGIAALRPNVRGSDGYGHEFERLDQVFKRQDSVKDIGALLDWIETQPDLDSRRVVIIGGSYGGYMSLASLAMYPDRFVAGVSRVGVTDFHSFMKNTEPYRVDNRRREYGDERDPKVAAFFERVSPLQNAHKITKPVLIMAGGQDPRVPQQQAEDMVKAIRKNGVNVSYLLFANEGHKVSKSRNKRFKYGAQIAFLREHLLNDKPK